MENRLTRSVYAWHFGSFAFKHGRIGGIFATDLYRPHARHGQDMVIIQARRRLCIRYRGVPESEYHIPPAMALPPMIK